MRERASRRRGVFGLVGSALLTLAAVAGAVCIVLVPLAFYFHISLIMFKTGSMSPTIPTGSLAVVQEVPASQIKVGDVVTIDRSPSPPVTHRVTSIRPVGDGTWTIRMRGDANPADDPIPYVVKDVRIVLFSFPKLAYAVKAVSSPYVMAGITVAAAALVTWAFWPRGEAAPRLRRGPAKHAAGPRHAVSSAPLAVVVIVAAAASVFAPARPARAAVSEEVITGPYLTLTSIGDKALMSHLTLGEAVPWQVGVAARRAAPGTVTISLSARGELVDDADGLQVTVRVCDTRWVNGRCVSGDSARFGPGPASTVLGRPRTLALMPSDQERWILVEAGLPADLEALPRGSASLVLTASGVGDRISAGGNLGPDLSATGGDLRPTMFAGLAAVLVGLVITGLARLVGLRQRRRDEEALP